MRNVCSSNLNKIYNSVQQADVEMEKALETGLIEEGLLIDTYKKLIEVLESDPYNKRLILYFPFELIPQIPSEKRSEELETISRKFISTYMDLWYQLLSTNDVRANFIDGDVLEIDLRTKPLERVTKVAHLIPILVRKGLISIDQISKLIEDNPGTTLQQSIVETLPVLVDMNLLSKHDMENILQTNHLEITKRQPVVLSEDKITEARRKWLKEKDEPIVITDKRPDQLDMPFVQREETLRDDISIIKSAMESIKSNPELNSILYPVSILFGSRLKGYGADNADLDVAIFIKPGISAQQKEGVQSLITDTFSHSKIQGKVFEFWLEEKDGELEIINFPNPDTNIGDNTCTHILFEGAWVGDESATKELYEKLLPGYLYSKGKDIRGKDARKIWLEEMEKDTLQYRLMHKGYGRFYERQGGIKTEHSDQIDGDSMFYDSGYRRLATKLFLSKVFLPQLER